VPRSSAACPIARDGLGVRDVGLDAHRALPDLARDLADRPPVDVQERDARAALRELTSRRGAQSGAPAGDDRRAALKRQRHVGAPAARRA
jgi:hypothetical protein